MFDHAALVRQAVLSRLQDAQDGAGAVDAKPEGIGVGPYAALVGGQAADIGTTLAAKSRGAVEANPLLGNFGAAAMAGKVGSSLVTALLMKKLAAAGHPTLAKVIGYGTGAGLGAVAARNATVGR